MNARRFSALAFTLALTVAASAAAASLKETLTPGEFARAGLGKLTPEELAYLDQIVAARAAQKLAARTSPTAVPGAESGGAAGTIPTGEAAFGREEQTRRAAAQIAHAPTEVRSRIQGPFAGWNGGATFTLENGQVWAQAEPGTFVVRLDSPGVSIRKGAFGTYYLTVEGYGSSVKVRRIK